MSILRDFFSPRQRLLQQALELKALRKQVAMVQAQNDSMREGMRRCVNCQYRIEYKNRRGQAPVEPAEHN